MARCVWLNGLDLDSTVVRSVRRILFDSNKIHFTPESAALDILHKFIDNYINKKKASAHFCTNAGYERVSR